jgi:ribosomal protein S18 acetylase RimI-like enzyme
MYTKPLPTNSAIAKIASPIRKATIADATAVVALEVLAFSDDPIARWIYPEPQQYLAHFPKFVKTLAGKAFAHQTAYLLEASLGAALWLPPGVEVDIEAMVELIQATVSPVRQADLFMILERMDHFHPSQSHWYLPIIGIEPTQQGKGYGSALMQPVLEECDRTQTPAYLESSNPKNIRFYQRQGFELLGRIQVGTSPDLFPMVRYPE